MGIEEFGWTYPYDYRSESAGHMQQSKCKRERKTGGRRSERVSECVCVLRQQQEEEQQH